MVWTWDAENNIFLHFGTIDCGNACRTFANPNWRQTMVDVTAILTCVFGPVNVFVLSELSLLNCRFWCISSLPAQQRIPGILQRVAREWVAQWWNLQICLQYAQRVSCLAGEANKSSPSRSEQWNFYLFITVSDFASILSRIKLIQYWNSFKTLSGKLQTHLVVWQIMCRLNDPRSWTTFAMRLDLGTGHDELQDLPWHTTLKAPQW